MLYFSTSFYILVIGNGIMFIKCIFDLGCLQVCKKQHLLVKNSMQYFKSKLCTIVCHGENLSGSLVDRFKMRPLFC